MIDFMFQTPYFVKVAVDGTAAACVDAAEIEAVAPGRDAPYPSFDFDAVIHIVTDGTGLIGVLYSSYSQTHVTAPVTQKCLTRTTQDPFALYRGIDDAALLVVNC
jgi:hypothetical protein